MRNQLFVSVAFAALMLPGAAYAQSTGSEDFDESTEIVVTGSRQTDVGGVNVPETPKAKVEIDRELLLRQTPGQTVNESLNLIPGANFTNNDPFGSLGGDFTIRGFNSSRISQTVDGIPLNDSGNYAVYTNQQQDPETLESVTVSLGSTDVDSPTASAAGGTINIRTLVPTEQLGALFSASYGNIISRGDPGDRPYHRVFGLIQTGDFTGFGTKAWFSASNATNESTYSNYGKVDKQQYNGRIYQDIGSNGDFVSAAFHYNENRNTFNGSPYSNVTIDSNGGLAPSDRFYDINYPCQTDTPQAGVADSANSCGSEFERRFNPSNTGNVRINSRFTLANNLILTVDPSFQYVKANGGGTSNASEGGATLVSSPTGPVRAPGTVFYGVLNRGSINSSGNLDPTGGFGYFVGRDLNGDGDLLDSVRILTPSQTKTRRIGVIANLSYELNESNRVRLSYTFDRAKHRQTGQAGFLQGDGSPFDVFPINDPINDANGVSINKRDRLSYATLNQVAGEYRGSFLNDSVIVTLGARAPFFTRDLNQYCFTVATNGNVSCVSPDGQAAYAAANPTFAPPVSVKYKYDKFLPNVGFTYHFTDAASIFASYSKNLSVPGTDDLYNSLSPTAQVAGAPAPETSNSFDSGFRYKTGILQAQLGGYYVEYQNRLASAYDPDCDCTVTRNLGKVKKYGVDGNVSVQPIPQVLVYLFGSYLDSEIVEDVAIGNGVFAPTAGNREAGSPKYLYGGRVQGTLGPIDLGFQIKRTGSRFLNDINTVTLPAYTVANLDVRYSLASAGLDKTYFQLNVTNLFDESYIGTASTGLTTTSTFVNIGPPRAIIGSLIVGF